MYTNKNILIVDDEEKARLYLANILHELFPNFTLQLASSPLEATFILSSQCIDLVFLDVEMPGMTGLEMLEQLRQKMKNIPVIFVSAYKRAEFIQKALRLNAIDYIDKPVDPIELKEAIEKAFKSQLGINNNINSLQKLRLYTSKGELFFEPKEIMYFETAKRNSRAFFTNNSGDVIVRENLIDLETKLPSKYFKRISRQYIINIMYIKFVSKCNQTISIQSDSNKLEIKKVFPRIFSELTLE